MQNENTDATTPATEVEETVKQFKVTVNFIAAKKTIFVYYTQKTTQLILVKMEFGNQLKEGK